MPTTSVVHALAHLRLRRGAAVEEVGVGVRVDEARGHHVAGGVDRALGGAREAGTDGGDPIALDGDVGPPRGAPLPSTTVPPRIRIDQAMATGPSMMVTEFMRVALLDPVHDAPSRRSPARNRVLAVEERRGPEQM